MKRLNEILNKKNAGKVLFFLAITGIVLIYLSTFTGKGGKDKVKVDTDEQYVEQLEDRLASVVEGITGEKNAQVLVSLESSKETVYADLVDESNDKSNDYEGDATKKTQEKSDTKQSLILVEDKDGGQQALVVTTIAPTVRGVVVVSSQAENEQVKERIVTAVTTALNIPSKKVCVVGGYQG